MGIIAALLPHQDRLRRLRAATRGRHQVAACADWGELRRLCETQPVSTAVFDLSLFARGKGWLDPVRQLRRLHPGLITIAYVAIAGSDYGQDLFDAGRVGIDGLVIVDRDDGAERFAGLLEQAEARGQAAKLRNALAPLPAHARDAVLIAVSRAHESLTPERLARALSLDRRALVRLLTASGLPRPRRLITWGRLIVAAQLLEGPSRSVDAVSIALAFPSGSAFRNTCQRYLGVKPSQLRTRGCATYVIGRLLAEAKLGEAGA
jgi:AraC-like DNA-binding protein